MGELRKLALRGVLWSGIDKVGVKLITFIVGIVIARILTPADYGVIGMIMIFITLAGILVDSGFSQAIVQKKEVSQNDLSTAFYFNLIVSVSCYGVLFLCAGPIARFYEMPILVPVLRVLGLNLIVISLATVQRANLIKKIDFRSIAVVNTSGALVSGVVGVCLAYMGFGVWALVFQQLSVQAVSTLIYWIMGHWRPSLCFSGESFRHLWKFGSKLLCAGLMGAMFNEIYSLCIGKFYRASELGYYRRAVDTTNTVSGTAGELINAVTFPILSSLQENRDQLVSVYSRMLAMTAFCIFPVMTMLAVVAHPFISLLLTDKWLMAVPLMQWLCFARMLTPVSSLNMNILNAVGRSDLFLKVDLSKIPVTIAIMAVTIPMGVKAIVIGSFVDTFICYFINAYMPGRMFGFGAVAQFRVFYRIMAATALMAGATWGAMLLFDADILKLSAGIISGLAVYLVSCHLMSVRELEEVRLIVGSRLHRGRRG